jgi:predicted  nucleic acid-binding Zn-ribbon protein
MKRFTIKLFVCKNCGLVYSRRTLLEWPGCSTCGADLQFLAFVQAQDDTDPD